MPAWRSPARWRPSGRWIDLEIRDPLLRRARAALVPGGDGARHPRHAWRNAHLATGRAGGQREPTWRPRIQIAPLDVLSRVRPLQGRPGRTVRARPVL